MFKSELFVINHINNRHKDIIHEKIEKDVIYFFTIFYFLLVSRKNEIG